MDTPLIQDQDIYGLSGTTDPLPYLEPQSLDPTGPSHNRKWKLLLFDSMGASDGQKQRKRITMLMKKLQLIRGKEKCQVINTTGQTEHECGARVAVYMIHFLNWAKHKTTTRQILRKLNTMLQDEEDNKPNLAATCRISFQHALKDARQALCGITDD